MKAALIIAKNVVQIVSPCCFVLLTICAADGAYLGTNRQLFVDDAMVSGSMNVDFTLHQPEKYSVGGETAPVLVADQPWEDMVTNYGTTVYDEQDQVYKMWYRATYNSTNYICYATSTNGINWAKPNLGLTSFGGSTNNNIVSGFASFYTDGFAVYKDLAETDPAKRYKLFTSRLNGSRTIAAMTSPDGYSWSGPVNTTFPVTGDVVSMYYDEGLGKYVGLTKAYVDGKRSRQVTYSDDFVTWTAPVTVLAPDAQDPATAHLYTQAAFMYEGMRIGYVSMYDTETEKLDTQLVTSRDGLTWERYRERETFLANGELGDCDSAITAACSSGLIVKDDQILIYYTGRNVDHSGTIIDGGEEQGGICLATLRKDGFTSADADSSGGSLTTTQFRLTGLNLSINAVTNGYGNVQAELLDAAGQVIAGYGAADSNSFSGDSLDAGVTWSGKLIDRSLLGQKVSLRFQLTDASLYSFGFRDQSAYVAAFDADAEGWTGDNVVWVASGGQDGAGYLQAAASNNAPCLAPPEDSFLYGDVAANLGGDEITVSYYLKNISGGGPVSLLMSADTDGDGNADTTWQWTPDDPAAPTDWTQYEWTVDTLAADGEVLSEWVRVSGDGSWADSWQNVCDWSFWSHDETGMTNVNGIDMLVATAVPEPGMFILLGSALVGLLTHAWRNRK
ncbi:MAG: PEP-CTERM sorting domain-containing protein [Pirellulales bacterium]|nr:PEP-CTERM sorting domain-containing protein [Pirellulales bacterium]